MTFTVIQKWLTRLSEPFAIPVCQHTWGTKESYHESLLVY